MHAEQPAKGKPHRRQVGVVGAVAVEGICIVVLAAGADEQVGMDEQAMPASMLLPPRHAMPC